ncbi:uncharacterized protein LOC142333107 [Lycorma delicatula]|uniref:uncharacterized protein LOC142333107 n=1 Tax=Lycorma delicatula TaxID=130591 RepID=UPI003F513795
MNSGGCVTHRNMLTVLIFIGIVIPFINSQEESLREVQYSCNDAGENFSECLETYLNTVRKEHKKGQPNSSLTSIDPVTVGNIIINQTVNCSGSVIFSEFDNETFTGLSNYKVSNLRYNCKDHSIEFVATYPSLNVKGSYIVKGNISNHNVNGTGINTIKLEHLKSKISIVGSPKVVDNKTFYNIGNVTFTIIKTHGVKIRICKWSDEKTIKANEFNKLVNKKWETLFKPFLEQAIQDVLLGLFNKVFTSHSYEKIFPTVKLLSE